MTGLINVALPLQLAGTSTNYFDFLLNSCATIFILELDDKEGVTFRLAAGPAKKGHYAINEDSDIDIRFAPHDNFEGARAGQVFKNGYSGVGYYPDTCAEDEEDDHGTLPSRDYPDTGAEDEEDDTPPTVQLTIDITSRGEVNERLRENISAADSAKSCAEDEGDDQPDHGTLPSRDYPDTGAEGDGGDTPPTIQLTMNNTSRSEVNERLRELLREHLPAESHQELGHAAEFLMALHRCLRWLRGTGGK